MYIDKKNQFKKKKKKDLCMYIDKKKQLKKKKKKYSCMYIDKQNQFKKKKKSIYACVLINKISKKKKYFFFLFWPVTLQTLNGSSTVLVST